MPVGGRPTPVEKKPSPRPGVAPSPTYKAPAPAKKGAAPVPRVAPMANPPRLAQPRPLSSNGPALDQLYSGLAGTKVTLKSAPAKTNVNPAIAKMLGVAMPKPPDNAAYALTHWKPVPAKKAPAPIHVASPSRTSSARPLPTHPSAAPSPVAHPTGTSAVHPVVSAVAQARNAQHAATVQQSQQQANVGGVSQQMPMDQSIQDRAANAVDLELTPAEQALQQQAAQSDARFQFEQAQAAADTQRTVNEQQMLYSKLNDQLNGQVPQIGANYDAAGNHISDLYKTLNDSLGQNYSSSIQATTDEAKRLGLDPAISQATAQMGSDQKFLQGLSGSDAAVLQGGLGVDKSNALRDALANIATQSSAGAALSGGTLRDSSRAANTAKFDQGQKISDLLGQASTLEGTRKGKVAEGVSALTQLQQQQQAQAQQAAISQQNEERKLRIQEALAQGSLTKDQADAMYKQGQLDISRKQLTIQEQSAALAQQKTKAELQKMAQASVPGSLEYQKVMSAIQLQTTQAAKNIEEAKRLAHPTVKPVAYGGGIKGAQMYLQDPANGIDPQVQAIAINAVNDLTNHRDINADYAGAVHEMNNKANFRNYPQNVREVMLRALALAANKGI